MTFLLLQETLVVFNNLLDDQHTDELSQLNVCNIQQITLHILCVFLHIQGDFGGEKLMSNIEDYGKYAGKFLVVYDNITNDTFAAEKENLGNFCQYAVCNIMFTLFHSISGGCSGQKSS